MILKPKRSNDPQPKAAMREIVVIERSTVSQNGRTVLHERRYHGLLYDDGFRLLAYCGKRIPQPPERARQPESTKETRKTAA